MIDDVKRFNLYGDLLLGIETSAGDPGTGAVFLLSKVLDFFVALKLCTYTASQKVHRFEDLEPDIYCQFVCS